LKPWEQILTNIANLFKVKTIVTLVIVLTFCFLTLRQINVSNEFVMIATAIITYYFAKPESRREAAERKAAEKREDDEQ